MTLFKKVKTCEDRIDGELEHEISNIEYMLNQKGNVLKDKEGNKYDNLSEWLSYYSVSYEEDPHYRAKRLALSFGGPSDGFRFFEDGKIEYYFRLWYDAAKRDLCGKNYEIAKELYDRCLADKE